MLHEIEPKASQINEIGNQQSAGKTAVDLFSQALQRLALSQRFESQKSLAKVLGVRQGMISGWLSGTNVPNPDNLGKLLVFFDPSDEERDALLNPYSELLIQRRSSSSHRKGVPCEVTKKIKFETPLGIWLEDFRLRRKLTWENLGKILGKNIKHANINRFGLNAFSQILKTVPEKLGLTEKEVLELGEAIAQTIQREIDKGRKFDSSLSPKGKNITKIQSSLPYPTFNGTQAGKELGVSRARVQQLREAEGLPSLLTKEDLEKLRARQERNKQKNK